ncbi:hypothetical protein [Synechococcus elongatus]|uniref:hypothetical protein n=1 Tax=Synechococcus elongatus TaxID=32046 RepID=UPI0030D44AE4
MRRDWLAKAATAAVSGAQRGATGCSDLDGTLTASDRFSPALIQALEQLAAAEIALITTGRSVGWGMALAQYLPVAG